MKKAFSIYIIIVCLILCGCSGTPDYTGKADIEKARRLHTELESSRVTVTDRISGEVMQEIEYKYAGEVMTYMYTGRADGVTYYEYNNGTELNMITIPEETEWSFIAKGDENFYSYSRSAPHYFANGELLFATYPTAISDASVVQREDGGKTYAYMYDAEELEKLSSFGNMGDITEFIMSYELDNNGYCKEISNSYTCDGEKYDFVIEISELNGIEEIIRTEIGQQ